MRAYAHAYILLYTKTKRTSYCLMLPIEFVHYVLALYSILFLF